MHPPIHPLLLQNVVHSPPICFPLPLSHFPLPFPLPPHQRHWKWPLPPNNCWRRFPFFSTFNTVLHPTLLNFSSYKTVLHSTQLFFWNLQQCATLKSARGNCAPPQACEKRCTVLEQCKCFKAIVWCIAKSSYCIVHQCIIEVGAGELQYNYCPIRTIGGEWGQEIDTSSKLHPTPSSVGLWMLSVPKNVIRLTKWRKN